MDELNVFKEFINSLDFELSPKDSSEPTKEVIEVPQDALEVEGSVLKISFNMMLFMNHEKAKYYMLTSDQKMFAQGEMSLKQAIAKFNKKPRRKS